MANFPKLKTDAVMQYPAEKRLQFSNHILRFIDGSEQRYRNRAAMLRTWVVRLDLLDEAELDTLEEFFLTNQGMLDSFAFTDPWNGTEYPDCSIDQEIFEVELVAELRGRTILTIRENRT